MEHWAAQEENLLLHTEWSQLIPAQIHYAESAWLKEQVEENQAIALFYKKQILFHDGDFHFSLDFLRQ